MANISLNAYEDAERRLAKPDARRGITVHALITAFVSVALIMVNVLVARGYWLTYCSSWSATVRPLD